MALDSCLFSGLLTLVSLFAWLVSKEAAVDRGGGYGFAICSILQKHQQMRGILFGLKETVPGRDQRIRELGLEERCRAVSGDFFQAVPEGGDV